MVKADNHMVVDASNTWKFGDFFNHSPPRGGIDDVAGKVDNTMLLLVNHSAYFAWRRSEFFIVEEKRAEPIVQSPILSGDPGWRRCGRGIVLPGIDAIDRLVGSGSDIRRQ